MAATTALLLLVPVPGAWAETFVVQNTDDSGAGSLRQAITDANAAAGGPSDLVDATGVTGEIALQTALPTLTGAFEIRGPGASALTVRRAAPAEFRIFAIGVGAEITLAGLTIANGLTPTTGTAATDEGGGIFNSGTVTVLRSAVTGNSGTRGGGIANRDGELTVRDSAITGNTARESGGTRGGGGIYNEIGTAAIVNSTVAGNTTGARGGGVINSTQSATEPSTVNITNSTIAGNTGAGANLFNSSNGGTAVLTFRSTIISNPQGGESNCGSAGAASFASASQGYNLADDDSCSLTATADQPSTNPNLGPLADNGGGTLTMALPLDSPAVDKGSSDGVTTDQRGLTRPVEFPEIPNAPGGNGADIGAFEVQLPAEPGAGGLTARSVTFDASKVKKGKAGGHQPRVAIRKGRKARLAGEVSAPQDPGACEANQTVELQRKKPKQSSFTTVALLQTDGAGNFSATRKVKRTLQYRVVLAETAVCDDAASGTEKVKAKKKKKAG